MSIPSSASLSTRKTKYCWSGSSAPGLNSENKLKKSFRGTLQDIIYNDQIALDEKFHGAFVRDVLQGLEYIHTSPIAYHGSLTPWSCLIDRNWMVKLTDYGKCYSVANFAPGIADPLERWEKQQSISVDALKSEEDKSQAIQKTSKRRLKCYSVFVLEQRIGALYDAPEMLKNREKNRVRRVDQDWVKQTQTRFEMSLDAD